MKLELLHISGFGRLEDLDVEFGPGLTVIAGPNEAGKSTIVECVLRLLFGFPETQYHKFRKRYEPWQPGAPYGAKLRYRLDNGRTFEVARDFGRPDVATLTVEADTRRPVPSLVGNRSTSPGEEALGVSLDVFRSAAVLTANDFATEAGGAADALADRLAAVVGSAGDASAADAIDRLRQAHGEIGLSGANTPLGKATREAEEAERALQRFHEDYSVFEQMLVRQSELAERVHDLSARRARCEAALASVRLRALRGRITAAADAQQQLDAALAHRPEEPAMSNGAPIDRAAVDSALKEFERAQQSAADSVARADAKMSERAALQREVDGAGAALMEKRAAAAHLDEAIAANERAAEGRPQISLDVLAALEADADAADAAESKARTMDTAAAIARQRQRAANPIGVVASVVAVIAAIAWVLTHAGWLAITAAVAAAAAIASIARSLSLDRARAEVIARAERAAAAAAEAASSAASALAAKCRMLGCESVAAVRAARAAQADIDRLRADRAAALEAADLLAAQRRALDQRLADFNALEAERRQSLQVAAQCKQGLASLFDAMGIAAGELDDRITAYRRIRDAGETSARAEAAIANARAELERALGGKTLSDLEAEASECASLAAGCGDPDEFGGDDRKALENALGALDRAHREAEASLEGARARVAEFDRLHPVPAAELEERAASAAERRDHYRRMRAAAECAWKTIEEVKDTVHRDFTPVLNDAVGRTLSAITAGRYAEAWVDPADFRLRVRVPETDATQDAPVLSTGTMEQMQFALRAALAAALGGGERVPILYDDALAHADGDRARAAVLRAVELAAQGEQVVFFTNRQDVDALATDIPGVRILRLPGPAA